MSIHIDLSGRTAWVTGAAAGIGLAIADMLRSAGARLVRLDRAYDAPHDGDSGQDRALPLDLLDAESVARVTRGLLDEAWAPDVLVNCAGITRDGVVWRLADEDWGAVVGVNLTGAFRMVRAVVPSMRERRSGAIVNIASINGLRGKAGQSNYCAAKGGLIAFTKTIARELGPSGVRANVVAPGFVETAMTARLPAEVRARAHAETALGRVGSPSDIASAVVFLSSPLAAHVTGQVLVVDGGQYM